MTFPETYNDPLFFGGGGGREGGGRGTAVFLNLKVQSI